MKKETTGKKVQKKRLGRLGLVCWIVLPASVLLLLLLDGLGLYAFTTERLIVLGAGMLVVLLPFFNEITVKNLSIKRRKDGE